MTTRRGIVSVLAGSLIMGSLACDGPGHTLSAPEVQQFDSAGISVVATRGDVARSASNWVVDSVPNLQIGSVSGAEPYEFHNIAGIQAQPDGTIRVLDGGTRQLRIFNSEGVFLHAIGRAGSGPGEFRSPRLVRSVMRDTLIVYDASNRRFTLLSTSGEVLGLSTLRGINPRGSPGPIAAVGLRILLVDRGLLWIGTGGLNPEPEPASFHVVDGATGAASALAEFHGRQMFTDRHEGMSAVMAIPFDIRPTGTAGERTFFVTPAQGPEILEYDTLAVLRRIIRIDEPLRRITQEDLDAFVARRIAAQSDPSVAHLVRNMYSGLPVASVMPAFEYLVVDSNGWLWARTYMPFRTAAEQIVYVVFDPTGKACGTVRVPGTLEMHDAGWNFVLGRWRDDLGVEHIRRYSLDRGETRESC